MMKLGVRACLKRPAFKQNLFVFLFLPQPTIFGGPTLIVHISPFRSILKTSS